jgi:hypothetical protein
MGWPPAVHDLQGTVFWATNIALVAAIPVSAWFFMPWFVGALRAQGFRFDDWRQGRIHLLVAWVAFVFIFVWGFAFAIVMGCLGWTS